MKNRKTIHIAVSLILICCMSLCAVPAYAEVSPDISAYESDAKIFDKYDNDKYMTPYWSGDTVYNEAVFPIKNISGQRAPFQLMYRATKILSVRDYSLRLEYHEGTDYVLENGKLVIPQGSAIRVYEYGDIYKNTDEGGNYPTMDGRYVYWCEGTYFHKRQISVTYEHDGVWNGPVPESKGGALPRTTAKLENKEPLKIVYFGDSLVWGASSSGRYDCIPYAPVWCDMMTEALKNVYGYDDITDVNSNEGGQTADWAASVVNQYVIQHNPDIAFIAFGMNDGMLKIPPSEFKESIQSTISAIKSRLPNTEIVIVTSMLANPECFPMQNFYDYADAMLELETDGIVVSDMTALHRFATETKGYLSVSGNNMCHVNDFSARMYTQTTLKTIMDDSYLANYKAELYTRLDSYASSKAYRDGESAAVSAIVARTKADIANSSDMYDAYYAMAFGCDMLDCVITDELHSLYENAVRTFSFNSSSVISGYFSNYTNLSASYDSSLNAVKLTARAAAYETSVKINLNRLSEDISADYYKYAVVTYMAKEGECPSFPTASFEYSVTIDEGSSDERMQAFVMQKGSEFYSEICDLSTDRNWTGELQSIIFSPFGRCNAGQSAYISSISFCTTADIAELYSKIMADSANASGMYSVIKCGSGKSTPVSARGTEYLLGDVSGDSRVNSTDILALRLCVATGTEDYSIVPSAADTNSDSKINASDVLSLRLGITEGFSFDSTVTDTPVSAVYGENTAIISEATASASPNYAKIDVSGTASCVTLVYMTHESISASVFENENEDAASPVSLIGDGEYHTLEITLAETGADLTLRLPNGFDSVYISMLAETK